MSIGEIISFERPKQNYYDILGCDQSSSIEQINKEYKIRALQLHPDKNPNAESLEKFRTLQRAKDVLSDESSRKSYDCWLNSRICIPFEQWHSRKAHSMMHWATPKSTKLSIKENSSSGQGSDFKPYGKDIRESQNDWLEKFRKYEI